LHLHKGAFRNGAIDTGAKSAVALVEKCGINVVRENLRVFFGLVDECYGLRSISYRDKAPQLKGTFLFMLARFLSDHENFWQGDDEKRLFVNVDHRRKFKQFDLQDPSINNLCGTGGKAADVLYGLIRDHINRGKRNKLQPRSVTSLDSEDEDCQEAA
jgi:hypothetical protein